MTAPINDGLLLSAIPRRELGGIGDCPDRQERRPSQRIPDGPAGAASSLSLRARFAGLAPRREEL